MQHQAEKNLKVACKAGCHLRTFPGKPVKRIFRLLLSERGRKGKWGNMSVTLVFPTSFLKKI